VRIPYAQSGFVIMDERFERIKQQNPSGLKSLGEDVRRDLERVNYPPRNWPLQLLGPDKKPVLDVLVVGAGMYGQTVAFALYREGIRNIRVVDKASRGQEGPWGTYARMEILRSPKNHSGPDLGIPSLTFRAWSEAQNGPDSWNKIYKIHRLDWLAYLLWVRDVLDLPVQNECELTLLAPAQDLLHAEIKSSNGIETFFAREVILATGREGTGSLHIPTFPSLSPAAASKSKRLFHSADEIDFKGMREKKIAIVGANASAFDNSAVALDSGVSSVAMFCRRRFLPQVNKARWMGFSGFHHGFPAIDDKSRWNFAKYTTDLQMPPPHESVQRCTRYANFGIHFGEPLLDVMAADDGVTLVTAKQTEVFDFVIFATGFEVDMSRRRELSIFDDDIARWGDRVSPEEASGHPRLAQFPYLGQDFEFIERTIGRCPSLSHLRTISYGAAMSHGALAGDIPGLALAATQIAQSISRSLFVSDYDRYESAMQEFEEAELEPTRFFVPKDQRVKRS
jgi:cation diffusion facilitator CzcD-associated flavoprotein CzcO